jgi:hypothetical protein
MIRAMGWVYGRRKRTIASGGAAAVIAVGSRAIAVAPRLVVAQGSRRDLRGRRCGAPLGGMAATRWRAFQLDEAANE